MAELLQLWEQYRAETGVVWGTPAKQERKLCDGSPEDVIGGNMLTYMCKWMHVRKGRPPCFRQTNTQKKREAVPCFGVYVLSLRVCCGCGLRAYFSILLVKRIDHLLLKTIQLMAIGSRSRDRRLHHCLPAAVSLKMGSQC